ncbi:hypothetical protein Atai01_45300 [Amycolatopsis taiwanensis]|uniref:Uncharacterized protein n=1 Tax=Amycolatopsis taiwanensis TaxID=342230 RepID=A0A9W6VIX1_9PSEU|nr:hypothetical protein Atai01_45300 [Amycolatopsis taiwanensis]
MPDAVRCEEGHIEAVGDVAHNVIVAGVSRSVLCARWGTQRKGCGDLTVKEGRIQRTGRRTMLT